MSTLQLMYCNHVTKDSISGFYCNRACILPLATPAFVLITIEALNGELFGLPKKAATITASPLFLFFFFFFLPTHS